MIFNVSTRPKSKKSNSYSSYYVVADNIDEAIEKTKKHIKKRGDKEIIDYISSRDNENVYLLP